MAGQSSRAQGATATTSSTNKKRKSTGGIDEGKTKPAKQPRKTLDAFFNPQVQVTSLSGASTGEGEQKLIVGHVELNEEQRRVLTMVVDEEKSVFFTGAAGACHTRFYQGMLMAQVVFHC